VSPELFRLAVCTAAYAVLTLAIGLVAARGSARTPEEYFLGGRGLGTAVLFMALFGTNCTSFVLVGIPGQAYHDGIGVFGLNAAILALGIPLSFFLVGAPARRMARRLGALTPAELYARRFGSRAVGGVLFAVFTLYTIPYMVVGVKGAMLTLSGISREAIPPWAAALGVIALTALYTAAGGMRSTAWTNVLQGAGFLAFMIAAFFFASRSLGGLEQATRAVAERRAELLTVGDGKYFAPREWLSWGLVISLTVISFPHMLARLMAAKDERAMKRVSLLYPLALAALWVPAVLLGFWGAAVFPGLAGRESDRIFYLMAAEHMPPWMGALGAVAVLCAVMSTLDAQLLTLSSMLVRDVLDPLRPGRGARSDVAAARWFGLALAAIVLVLSLAWGRSLFQIADVAFSGYTTLAPTLYLGVAWKRFTATAAIASILAGNAVLLAGLVGFFPLAGFLPVFWAFLAASATAVAVALLGARAPAEATARAFGG
jgi:SSS family solute:Na+ symporter